MAVERDFRVLGDEPRSGLRKALRWLFLAIGWAILGVLALVWFANTERKGWSALDTWMLVGLAWGWIGYQGLKDQIEHNRRQIERLERLLRDIDSRL
jgi:hypothetical protein